MFIYITGFLTDDSEDDSLKFDLDIEPEYERAVMDTLGWKNLAENADGELLLTSEQVRQIETVIKQSLPHGLDIFIGVRA